MAGEKNRFTTQEKLWKLDAETLSTPKHDEMVLWLLNKENVNIFPEVEGFLNNNQRWTSIRPPRQQTDARIYQMNGFWEKIKSTNSPETPFGADFERLRKEYLDGNSTPIERSISIMSEVPIQGKNGFILENPVHKEEHFVFWSGKEGDVYYEYHIEIYKQYYPVFIEVKPKIKSFGETLRQLKTYQAYVPESVGRTYLFTCDLGFAGAFESQGIKVIEYGK